MSEFKDVMTAYGADYQATMSRFMGNERTYLKFLNMFFADESFRKLGTALQEGDGKGAFEAAHNLTGVPGSLGLTPRYEATCDMVEPLRTREKRDYAQLYRVIQDEFHRVEILHRELSEGVRHEA